MRSGDFGVEVVARGKGIGVRETASGHVLARPGQVYAIRLRNFGPLRCVADISIDGRSVTAGGLVIEPWTTEELERPISADEDGRFTVVAEGDERVFGPDGGRDNPELGLIEVRFRRELPNGSERPRPLPPTLFDFRERPSSPAAPAPGRPYQSPVWNAAADGRFDSPNGGYRFAEVDELFGWGEVGASSDHAESLEGVERAAGTGLTGRSTQRFVATELGPLEAEATRIQLRLVIADAEAIGEASSPSEDAPARPAARP